MSRVVSDNKTISSDITGYDESDHSYYAISNASQGYDGADDTNYASVNLTRGSSAETHIYWEFTLPEVPEGATIESITCRYKARTSTSSTSYINTATIQLYSGTTAKGSSVSIRTTSTSASSISSPGTWTAEEVNAGIRLMTYARRGSSRTTSNYYIYFYGATISITYSINGTLYEITAQSNVDGVSVTPASQEVFQGGDGEVTITGDLTNTKVTDNGTDVTNQLVAVTGTTIEATAESQTHSGIQSGSSYAEYAIGRSAEEPYSSTSNMYASDEGYVDYAFDFSAIPADAEIESVEVRVYGHRESSTTDSTHIANVQLYSGSNAKGSDQDFTSTSNQLITISNPGTWTRTELQYAILRFTVGYYGGLICGITWEVTYRIDSYHTFTVTNIAADHTILVVALSTGNKIYIKKNGSWVEVQNVMVKSNGSWVPINKVYKKSNNSWTEQDKSAVFDNNNTYLKG